MEINLIVFVQKKKKKLLFLFTVPSFEEINTEKMKIDKYFIIDDMGEFQCILKENRYSKSKKNIK